MEDEPERQRGFDGEIGILPLPATFADAHGLPSGDRIRGQPHGDIAALDQRSFVCRPIPDVVFCLVLWVHSRLHVEIMHLLSPRWPGGRSWLTEGAGSVHQRLVEASARAAESGGTFGLLNPLFADLPAESFASAFEKSGVSPAELGSGYTVFFVYSCLVGLVAVVLAVIVTRQPRTPG